MASVISVDVGKKLVFESEYNSQMFISYIKKEGVLLNINILISTVG